MILPSNISQSFRYILILLSIDWVIEYTPDTGHGITSAKMS